MSFTSKCNLHLDFVLIGTDDFKYSVYQTKFCSKGYYKGLPLLHNNFYKFKNKNNRQGGLKKLWRLIGT